MIFNFNFNQVNQLFETTDRHGNQHIAKSEVHSRLDGPSWSMVHLLPREDPKPLGKPGKLNLWRALDLEEHLISTSRSSSLPHHRGQRCSETWPSGDLLSLKDDWNKLEKWAPDISGWQSVTPSAPYSTELQKIPRVLSVELPLLSDWQYLLQIPKAIAGASKEYKRIIHTPSSGTEAELSYLTLPAEGSSNDLSRARNVETRNSEKSFESCHEPPVETC